MGSKWAQYHNGWLARCGAAHKLRTLPSQVTKRDELKDAFIWNTMSTPAITFMDTSPESCDHLRQAINDEIIPLEESTRALKSRQNELASISRLPPEILAVIFFFHSLSTWCDKTAKMAWIRVAHVCRLWRETALNHPRVWSHINFTKLTSAGMVEILSRAKLAPLNLEADIDTWSKERVVAFGKQLEAHISHTRHLSISGSYLRPVTLLEQFVSSAPILEFLSLSQKFPCFLSDSERAIMLDNLFNHTPSLISLELENCDFSWTSRPPFLKGLRSLQICELFTGARPKLEDWLDALNEMPQLEELSLQFATPLAPETGPLISESSRSSTLTSLTRFHISDFPKECALAVAHLVLPALTHLHVDVESRDEDGEDVQLVIPYVARNVCGMQDIEPLRSILFSGERRRAEVLVWTMPDADINVCDSTTLLSESASARLMFTATCEPGMEWHNVVVTAIYDALLTLLPVNSVSTFTAQNHTQLSKEFWLNQAPRLPLLERVRLIPTAVKAFRDMLAEDAPPDGPRLPLLTKLSILDVFWTSTRTYHFRDMLIGRVEQGVPLESLDLCTCEEPYPPRAKQIFAEIVVDAQGPLCSSRTNDFPVTTWPCEVEYDSDWVSNSVTWYGLDLDECEDDYTSSEYDYDSEYDSVWYD